MLYRLNKLCIEIYMYNNNEKISHEGEQRGQAIWNFEWMKGKKSDMVSFKKEIILKCIQKNC